MRELQAGHPSLSPAEILDMVTRNPARAIGLSGMLGEIIPGTLGDLIALPYKGDPANVLEAIIENVTEVEWMMVQGRMIHEAAKDYRT